MHWEDLMNYTFVDDKVPEMHYYKKVDSKNLDEGYGSFM